MILRTDIPIWQSVWGYFSSEPKFHSIPEYDADIWISVLSSKLILFIWSIRVTLQFFKYSLCGSTLHEFRDQWPIFYFNCPASQVTLGWSSRRKPWIKNHLLFLSETGPFRERPCGEGSSYVISDNGWLTYRSIDASGTREYCWRLWTQSEYLDTPLQSWWEVPLSGILMIINYYALIK